MIDRRTFTQLGIGMGLVVLTSRVSACSPALPSDPNPVGFADALVAERWTVAEKMISPKAELIMIRASGSEVIAGPQNIVRKFRQLLDQKYQFAPFMDGEKEGPIWEDASPWERAVIWRAMDDGSFFDNSCGTRSDAFHILVTGSPFERVVILQAPPTEIFASMAVERQAKKANG